MLQVWSCLNQEMEKVNSLDPVSTKFDPILESWPYGIKIVSLKVINLYFKLISAETMKEITDR